jgi:hypothetical protein
MYNKIVVMLWVGQLRITVQFLGGARDFSPLHGIQTGSVAHPASYSMGINGSFLKGKVAAS